MRIMGTDFNCPEHIGRLDPAPDDGEVILCVELDYEWDDVRHDNMGGPLWMTEQAIVVRVIRHGDPPHHGEEWFAPVVVAEPIGGTFRYIECGVPL